MNIVVINAQSRMQHCIRVLLWVWSIAIGLTLMVGGSVFWGAPLLILGAGGLIRELGQYRRQLMIPPFELSCTEQSGFVCLSKTEAPSYWHATHLNRYWLVLRQTQPRRRFFQRVWVIWADALSPSDWRRLSVHARWAF